MTREEIMAARILPKQVVREIREMYWADNEPYFEVHCAEDEPTEEEIAAKKYISPEKVQRMPPETVTDYLVRRHRIESADDVIRILSVATGRGEDDLRQAIFGEGRFEEKDFYYPTETQKEIIKFRFRYLEYGSENIPEKAKKEFDVLMRQVPEEAREENIKEAVAYIKHYADTGIYPAWLIYP